MLEGRPVRSPGGPFRVYGLRRSTFPVGVRGSSAPPNGLRFAGQHLDLGTGLYHLRARDYDPSLGRFTSEDPVAPKIIDPFVASYVYARNQPTVLGDLSGMVPEPINPALHSEVNEACLGSVTVLSCAVEYVAAAGVPLPVMVCMHSTYTGSVCSLMSDYQDPSEHYINRTFGASHKGLGFRRLSQFLRGCTQTRKQKITCTAIGALLAGGIGARSIDATEN